MTEPQCLCEQCKMTVLQCKERSAKSSDKVLDELEKWIDTRWRYYAKNPVYYYDELKKKIAELRTKERGRP